MIAEFTAPEIDYAGISPIIALTTGIVVTLLLGLLPAPGNRWWAAAAAALSLLAAGGLAIWQWGESGDLVAGALRLDELGLAAVLIAVASALLTLAPLLREPASYEAGHGEIYLLLLSSVLGMTILAQAQNLIALFIGFELLSIPLYVLCGSAIRRRESLESGLKYLIIGSVGAATMLYGLGILYGFGGSTDYAVIAEAVAADAGDVLLLVGIGLVLVGFAFKLSLAPFHQWTPDVYEGAPTPVTSFMAVATKAAAFIALARLLLEVLAPALDDWQPVLAVIAVISIVVGNAGAIGQDSIKRLLGYSGIAQAGYMLAGVIVATEAGLTALVFYLAIYVVMNVAAFTVVVVRERETSHGDRIESVAGLGSERPVLAWSMTIAMLALAGLPGTAGFIGKLSLIEASVAGDYTWLGVVIVVGSMVSLAYYLRIVAAMWMSKAPVLAIAGGAPQPGEVPGGGGVEAGNVPRGGPTVEAAEAAATRRSRDPGPAEPNSGPFRCIAVTAVAVICAVATIAAGIAPDPLFDWARDAAQSLGVFT